MASLVVAHSKVFLRIRPRCTHCCYSAPICGGPGWHTTRSSPGESRGPTNCWRQSMATTSAAVEERAPASPPRPPPPSPVGAPTSPTPAAATAYHSRGKFLAGWMAAAAEIAPATATTGQYAIRLQFRVLLRVAKGASRRPPRTCRRWRPRLEAAEAAAASAAANRGGGCSWAPPSLG